jgi:O-acetyl-ADP-ribose deacetylase (regulator of RNase III)
LQYKNGDLLQLADQGEFDVIIHGCNCFHTFGAGIAYQILRKWPAAYLEDVKTSKGGRLKLGRFSSITQSTSCGKLITIINAYTQYEVGGNKVNADYDAIRSVFERVYQLYGKSKLRFGIPKIGAGLAGGDWNIIEKIINDVMAGERVTCVLYNGGSNGRPAKPR